MRKTISIIPADEAEVAKEIAAFNDHERHFYEEALSLLSKENSAKAAGEILWLRSLGKEFLKKTSSRAEIAGQLEDIQDGVRQLRRVLSLAVPKTQYLLAKNGAFPSPRLISYTQNHRH